MSNAGGKSEPPSKIVLRYLSTNKTDKSLGQNFLIDETPIHKSVEFSKTLGLGKLSNVLEIGPGPGTLTSAIWNTGA
ncbi:MAG: rRNA adenine N-6-methyltransferase family protein, partial [Candidatus Thermoplasmatota archaeon]|nr:rRNA adenine N-6-methyltransferase family protein [Candidatus Thermoplasmatota archaeon]